MRVLGAHLPRASARGDAPEPTLVLLDSAGHVARAESATSLPALAAAVARLAGGEPFLLGVDVPVVVPARGGRLRRVESLARRRLGFRLPPGGRAAPGADPGGGVIGETLLAGLAAAGQPCLPYPDRDRRQPGLAEIHPRLTLKALLWERAAFAATPDPATRELLFRGYEAPEYGGARGDWAGRLSSLDQVLRALGAADGFDFAPAREAVARVASERDAERAAGLLDATLVAGTARRYLEAPETCLFLGDRDQGYVILPADGFVRRLALGGGAEPAGGLFPQTSLRERLGAHAQVRSGELLSVPGRPQRTEAVFRNPPRYEFDNLDEMLWWKHCRHLAGPRLPTRGLHELHVALDHAREDAPPLKLHRSRHRTLSFRFEPPALWRASVPTRDGRTYPFRVLRAVYETLPTAD